MKNKKIGIWVRVSSTMQVDRESHVHHEMRAKDFVKTRDWNIVKTYRLEALSGKSVMGYEETQRMLNDIKSGAITGLVFSKIARLARNTKELIEISEIFQEHNADLISMDMSIDTSTSIGRHFFRQMSSMAEWEREMISERISASVKTRADLGKHLGGQAPFGYKYEDKKLVPHEEEAPVRRLMFELFLEHKRKRTVANMLNERGHRTKRGNKFTDSTVRRLLTDPVAKGLHIMNRRYSSSAKPNAFKPKDQWAYHNIEPIVSEDLWNTVNDIIIAQKRSHKPVLNTKVHLFTGFVFCECGGRMYTRYNSENYVCHNSCGNKIRKDDLEAIYKSELHDYSVSKNEVGDYFSRLKVILKDREKELKKLKNDKKRLDSKIEKIVELHAEGKIATSAFQTYYDKPQAQLVQVETAIEEIERDISFDSVAKKSTTEILELATNLYDSWDDLTHESKREVIETITEKIIVAETDIEINLTKILPDSHIPPSLEFNTNGQHTLSDVALVGGGGYPQPGEISLAHNGVLFLDELPEFKRTVLEVMRQPLEDRTVNISRAKFSVDYPAAFMLVASMNPCPCGYYNHPEKDCMCAPGMVQKYLNKISGPLLDRIDLHIEVTPVSFSELTETREEEKSSEIRKRVDVARRVQGSRYDGTDGIHSNAHMGKKELLKYCIIDQAGKDILKKAMDTLGLSARAYDRILKVARTIADLEESIDIKTNHLAEAIQYRSLDRDGWAS